MQHRSFLEELFCKVQLVIFLFLHFVPVTFSEVPLNFMKNEHAKTSLNESDIIKHEVRQISRPETNASRLLAPS